MWWSQKYFDVLYIYFINTLALKQASKNQVDILFAASTRRVAGITFAGIDTSFKWGD